MPENIKKYPSKFVYDIQKQVNKNISAAHLKPFFKTELSIIKNYVYYSEPVLVTENSCIDVEMR